MNRRLDPTGPERLLARPSVARVLAVLARRDEETRLVGGCVRDALLGYPVSDIDLATTLLPRETLAIARAAGLTAIPTGIEHGTVTVRVGSEAFEVTTLREDVETDGRHAVVRFGRDFVADAQRRDFTINALSLGPDGSLHDTMQGCADLRAGRVRFIGAAAGRIREDALRILRFFRFHARYGLGVSDPEGLSACIAARAALDGLSRERVRTEFLKLLTAPGALDAIRILSDTGLLVRIIGGVGDLGRLGRLAASHGSERIADDIGLHRLAALAVFSVADASRLRRILRLSNAEQARLTGYARAAAHLHGRAAFDADAVRPLAARHGVAALAWAVAALDGEPRPRLTGAARDLLARLESGAVAPPTFPLTGADLVARGITPGPEVGRRLATARALWLDRGCPEGPQAQRALLDSALAAQV